MNMIQFRGARISLEAFDAHVQLTTEVGAMTNAYVTAHHLNATRSAATRRNIEASFVRLVAAGFFVREDDFAVTDLIGHPLASPVYRRVR